jgi:hypothetical protein
MGKVFSRTYGTLVKADVSQGKRCKPFALERDPAWLF